MSRSLFCLAAALSLAACGPTGTVASAGSTPAESRASALPSLSGGLSVALSALDAATTAAEALLAAGVIRPGSATALRIADAIDGARTWIETATLAQRAGQAQPFTTAIEQAKAATAGITTAIEEAPRP